MSSPSSALALPSACKSWTLAPTWRSSGALMILSGVDWRRSWAEGSPLSDAPGLSACGFRGLCPQVCHELRVCYLSGICLPTSGPGHKRRSYSPRGELCGACAGLPQAGGSPGGHQPPSPAPSRRRCCRLQLQGEGHAPPGAGLLPYSAGVVPVGGLLGEGCSAEQHHQHQEASMPPSVW